MVTSPLHIVPKNKKIMRIEIPDDTQSVSLDTSDLEVSNNKTFLQD